MCSPLYKGGETKLKVGVNALEGGVVNTVKTLNVENGGGYMTPPPAPVVACLYSLYKHSIPARLP